MEVAGTGYLVPDKAFFGSVQFGKLSGKTFGHQVISLTCLFPPGFSLLFILRVGESAVFFRFFFGMIRFFLLGGRHALLLFLFVFKPVGYRYAMTGPNQHRKVLIQLLVVKAAIWFSGAVGQAKTTGIGQTPGCRPDGFVAVSVPYQNQDRFILLFA